MSWERLSTGPLPPHLWTWYLSQDPVAVARTTLTSLGGQGCDARSLGKDSGSRSLVECPGTAPATKFIKSIMNQKATPGCREPLAEKALITDLCQPALIQQASRCLEACLSAT